MNLEKTIKVQPNYALAHFTLGNLLSELKHYEKNIEAEFKRCQREGPKEPTFEAVK